MLVLHIAPKVGQRQQFSQKSWSPLPEKTGQYPPGCESLAVTQPLRPPVLDCHMSVWGFV